MLLLEGEIFGFQFYHVLTLNIIWNCSYEFQNLPLSWTGFRVKSKSEATKTNCRKQPRNQKAKLIVTTSRLTSSLQASLVFRRKFWSASANGFVSSSLLLSSNHANDFFCLKLRPASGASGKYWLLYFLSGCFSPLKKDTTFCFQASLTTWKILAYDLRAKKKIEMQTDLFESTGKPAKTINLQYILEAQWIL